MMMQLKAFWYLVMEEGVRWIESLRRNPWRCENSMETTALCLSVLNHRPTAIYFTKDDS